MRRFPCLAVFVLVFGLCAPASAEVASALLLAGDPLPGSPPGHAISALNNTAVNHSLGFAVRKADTTKRTTSLLRSPTTISEPGTSAL